MSGVNKAIILGRLGRDPELRYMQNGTPVCKLNVATSRKYKNRHDEMVEETEWHRITVWGKQAEHCNNYLAKGREVYIEGRLRTSSYEKDGQKHYTTEIVADAVQFIGGRNEGGRPESASSKPKTERSERPRQQRQANEDDYHGGGEQFDPYEPGPGDDDIPF